MIDCGSGVTPKRRRNDCVKGKWFLFVDCLDDTVEIENGVR